MENNTFYVTRRFPCGHSVVYEHPAIVLRKMTRAGLVPRDQEFAQVTVHLSTSDDCSTCGPTSVRYITKKSNITTTHQHQTTTPATTKSLLKHIFCCEHNMRRPMHESVLAKLRKHQVIPPDYGGSGEPIVLEVESSYCEACQEAKMREVHASLDQLKHNLSPKAIIGHGDDSKKSSSWSSRREDELRDVFHQLEEAQLTAELAPRHFRGALRIFADICVAAIAPPELLRAWVQTLTSNDYMVTDVQRAIEERLARQDS
ncbi:hypothetical protein PG996_008013 [Apiospora saccharicola]|uniref:Uncharacterized protein n=1 Tax=Apiospora saccharicola TaxID=335842 RepID=A0ABR1UWQ5_9PEZI